MAGRPDAGTLCTSSIVHEQQAEQSHHQSSGPGRRDAYLDRLEATELTRIRSNYTQASSVRRARNLAAVSQGPPTVLGRARRSISSFWKHQISVTVDHVCCRDHLALERTFLGYLRTSLAISIMGVTVAQLFRLQHSPNASPTFGFFVLGKPLAMICQGIAIIALLLGAFRTWRIQNALVRGKAIAGGCELVLLGVGVMVTVIAFTVLVIAVDISREF